MKAVVAYLTCAWLNLSLSLPVEKWELAISRAGIEVYVSEIPGSRYLAFKAVMSVKSTQAEIVNLLREVKDYPEWFAFTASAKLIAQTSQEQVFFMETDYPWPFSNECMTYSMKFEKQGGNTQKITITETTQEVGCTYSLKKANGYILLEPEDGETRITYYFHSEPSQNIPSWLVNPRIHEMPYQTFLSLKLRLNE